MLVLETKGQDTEQDRVKRRYLDEWTQAVNAQGGFGWWRWDVAKKPGEIRDILTKHDGAEDGGYPEIAIHTPQEVISYDNQEL